MQDKVYALLEKCKKKKEISFNSFDSINYYPTFATSNNTKDNRKDDEQCITYYSRGGPSSH